MALTTLGGKREGVPDILDAIAAMSSDAVPTPPVLARAMLDLLPDEVWTDPTLRWLDPAVKSGSILREVAVRLMDGLAEWEPDVEKRAEHILRNMLYGVGITKLHSEMGRRSLYVSRDATGPKAAIEFELPEGNLPFVQAQHDYPVNRAGRTSGNCTICGAPPGIERGEDRENYAYAFIHGAYPTEEMSEMKFDVIVGNPPYQVADGGGGGGASSTPVYQNFVDSAISLAPKYVSMIVPSRWFAGGKGLDEFRARMIADRRLAKIVDNPKLFDCFPGVEIKGGVNYFMWDREHIGDCDFSTRVDGEIRSTATRDLRDGDGVLIRDNRAGSIVEKVLAGSSTTADSLVSVRLPFGQNLATTVSDFKSEPFENSVPLVFVSSIGYVRPEQITRNQAWVDQYKVLLPKAGDGHGREVAYVLGDPIALAPGSACTETYLVAGIFDTATETENYANYLATKFVRFLVLQRKVTQNMTSSCSRFVPILDFKRSWTDMDLNTHFGLAKNEIEHIEASIMPRSVNLSLDSSIPSSHLPGGYKYRPPGKRRVDEATEDDE